MCDKNDILESNEPSTELLSESEYKGKSVTLNKPFRTPGEKKKFGVYVKNSSGNVVVVRFGDPNMEIKRDDPDRRAAFRARHNCADAKDKTTPRYWSCYQWRASSNVAEAKEMEGDDPCWKDYEMVGHKMKNGKKVPNCVPKEESSKVKSFSQYTNEGQYRDKADLDISKELERDKLRHDRMRDAADRADAASAKSTSRLIKQESVSIPLYVQEAAYTGNIGMMELIKFYQKAKPNEVKQLQTMIRSKMDKDAWQLVQKITGVKLVGKEFATEGKVLKNLKRFVAGKTASQRASQEHDKAADAYDADDSANTKKHLKRAVKLNNLTQKEETVAEEAPANSVSGGGVDMNPTGKPKWDKRSKFHVDHMFKRAHGGTKYKK